MKIENVLMYSITKETPQKVKNAFNYLKYADGLCGDIISYYPHYDEQKEYFDEGSEYDQAHKTINDWIINLGDEDKLKNEDNYKWILWY